MPKPVILNGDTDFYAEDLVSIARYGAPLRVSEKAMRGVRRCRKVVESRLTDGEAHYGINTGFGSLAKKRINLEDLDTLQRNLVRSHSAGVGAPLARDVVRAMMTCLAASLSRGYSGVRPRVIELLVGMLNKGVTPVVPSLGSVGASGDLAPLAAVALCMIGEGRCEVNGREVPTSKALAAAGLEPITLKAKEGLALINGTHLMCGWGALLAQDARDLVNAATVALAMSIDACRASHSFLDERLYAARNMYCSEGRWIAERVRGHLEGSTIRASHLENDPRVQDPYSLRAASTVLGAVDNQLDHFDDVIRRELGGVTDNPLVFPAGTRLTGNARMVRRKGKIEFDPTWLETHEDAIVSGANFHGMPLAIPLDSLAIAVFHIAGISERRSYLMTGAFEPESHLKPFLTPQPGLSSGLMIAQYTAAACVNEMATLATPASVVNITTCAGMEDYNSFGPRAAAKAARSIELGRSVVSVEMLCAAQGLEVHRPLRSGHGVEEALKRVRSLVSPLTDDRPLTDDIRAVADAIADGVFSAPVLKAAPEKKPDRRAGRRTKRS